VGLGGIVGCTGSKPVSNDDVLTHFPGKTSEDIIRTTGISSRQRVQGDETALSLAVKAAEQVLSKEDVQLDELDMIVCSTGTPEDITPSMACRILHALGGSKVECQAHDVIAACSGYLYAMQAIYDFLQANPAGKALLVTAEVLSPLLDSHDFNTSIIFGDAATATLFYGEDHLGSARATILRPVLSASGESGEHLRVPLPTSGEPCYISMNGAKVFVEGVRKMTGILKKACREHDLAPDELDLIIPHQANQRIIDAIRNRVGIPEARVFSNISTLGNTSSSSIPLALIEALPKTKPGAKLGLTAFGGGFTYGAAILEVK